MSSAYLKRKIEERAGLADLVSTTLDKCAAENRDPSPEERQQLDSWSLQCKSLDDEIAKLEVQFRGNQRFDELLGRLARDDEKQEERQERRRETPPPEQRKSFGQQFVDSDAFEAYTGSGTSARIEFEGFLERRAAITTGDLNIPAHQWSGPSEPSFSSPLLNAVGREPVSSGTVEWDVWGDASAAQIVAEGGLKPEATLTSTPDAAALDTFAHWKEITRQALEDKPRIQSIVETKLRRGLTIALEDSVAAVLLAAGFGSIENDDLAAGIRVALGRVQGSGYQPNAVLLNPDDYADLDIDAAAAANNGPSAFTTYWGLRPIPVPDLPAGTSYVGDFKEAISWFDRNRTGVYMTDSHADNFIRNKLLILAETRAKFAATNLLAAIKVAKPPVVPLETTAAKTAAK